MTQTAQARTTYLDCLTGKASVPTDMIEKFLFQLFMVGGMVTFMVTVNGLMHMGVHFFSTARWMYPLVFCIAFSLRQFVASPISGAIITRFVLPRFNGLLKNIAITVVNVLCMAPLMSMIVTLLLQGTDNYLGSLMSVLPYTPLIALCVNFFIVSPVVKMVYNNRMRSKSGVLMLEKFRRRCMCLTCFFGN